MGYIKSEPGLWAVGHHSPERRDFVCGTRRAFSDVRGHWVVCATCGAGGSVRHATREQAMAAAVRDSDKLFCNCRR